MIASASRGTIIDRMLGAALLEAETYQEAAVAPSLRNQAVLVVAITALAAGVGNLGGGLTGLLLAGLANKQIGSRLDISEKTVAVHRSNLMSKLGATSLVALVRLARTAQDPTP